MTDIAELRRLLAEATPGPWLVDEIGDVRSADRFLVAEVYHLVNARLIAALRNAAPELLDRLEAAEGHLAAERQDKRRVEYERDAAHVILARAEDALADARSVPTRDLEAGIRALTRERDHARDLLHRCAWWVLHDPDTTQAVKDDLRAAGYQGPEA